MAAPSPSTVRSAGLRSGAWSLAKNSSIELRSGE